MAVDLGDLIPSLQAEVSPPGEDLYPDALEDDWFQRLQDGFWEAVLDGLISGYNESEGIVEPTSGTTDLSRELQQLVVFYAGFKIVRNSIRSLNTKFRSKAGPVEFETEKAAGALRDILKELQQKRAILLQRLGDLGVTDTYYIDAVLQRDSNYADGLISWVGVHEGTA